MSEVQEWRVYTPRKSRWFRSLDAAKQWAKDRGLAQPRYEARVHEATVRKESDA